MKLSDPQRALLAEIADGSARYVRSYSRYGRTARSLQAKGLVVGQFVGFYGGGPDTEYQLTDEGWAVLESSKGVE